MVQSGMHLDGKIYTPDSAFPEEALLGIGVKGRAGIAISGGGTRSAGLAAGQLRALVEKKKFNQYRYVSMVSGGTWGTFPLFYLNTEAQRQTYLGSALGPAEITLGAIQTTLPGSMAWSLSNATLIQDALRNAFSGHEAFADGVGDAFLAPLGLDGNRFITWDSAELAGILGLHNNQSLRADDFYSVDTDWEGQSVPFPIAACTVMRHQMNCHFEMTPLYTGISGKFSAGGSVPPGGHGQGLGGGKIAPHLVDTDGPTKTKNSIATCRLASPNNMFALRDVLCTTGCPPTTLLPLPFLPNYKYWSPAFSSSGWWPQKEQGYDFADGGILENFGIMPLLRRGCERIVLFINAEFDIAQLDLALWEANQHKIDPHLDDAIVPLFLPAQNRLKGNAPGQDVVFENLVSDPGGQTPLVRLVRDLKAKAFAGEITFHTDTYKVVDNPNFGIAGGWTTQVTWVYNCMPQTWETLLLPDVRSDAANQWRTRGQKPFPFLATFFQNAPDIVKLTPEQANMLGHLSYWITKKLIDNGEI